MIRLPFVNKLSCVKWIQSGAACGVKQISTAAFPLQFQISPALWAEPLKKKKRIDPAIVRAREERKKKKIAKQIKKLEKLEKFFKPVEELQTPRALIDNPEKRKRIVELTPEEEEARIILLKEWGKEKGREEKRNRQQLYRLEFSQKNALQQLRLESEELYQAAVKIDSNLIPFKYKGPVETPPKENYSFPDGEYIDITRKWD